MSCFHAQEGAADVLFQVGIVVEVVVRGRIPGVRLHPVEIAVVLPGDEALVVEAVRKPGGLQDTRGVLDDAVPDTLDAVLDVLDGVLAVEGPLHLLLVFVLFPFRLGESLVPAAIALLRGEGGIGQVQGVDAGPVQGVARGFQGVDDEAVGEGVLDGHIVAVEERIGIPEAFRDPHRITRVNPGRGVGVLDGHAEKVEVVVRQVLQDSVLLHGCGLLPGILRYGIVAQRVQAHLPQEPHPGAGMYGPGGFHPHRPDDREPCDDRRDQYFGPQIFHQPTKIRIISGIPFSPASLCKYRIFQP